MIPVFYIIWIFFLIGAAGTAIANRKATPAHARQNWLKFTVHFLIVNTIACMIVYYPSLLPYAAGFILLTGLYELIVVIKNNKRSIRFYVVAFIIYFMLAAGFFMMTIHFSSAELILIFLIVFTFDGFSQITGQIAGKRKLFPRVSPGKTLEGLAGGCITGFITGFIIRNRTPFGITEMMFIAAVLMLTALIGDWLASFYKRKHLKKDFSELIPGHGGVLDRFDSWIMAGAVIWLLSVLSVVPI